MMRRFRKSFTLVIGMVLILALFAGCSNSGNGNNTEPVKEPEASPAPATDSGDEAAIAVDEQPSTVFYEIFVRSFYDSDGDGIGDLRGITQKLDYLNDGDPATDGDLGIGGIWLMPINPSPSYHGYDVTDYYGVNPDYGTMDDLKQLLDEAHKRGIKVIMDLVVNHTGVTHPWFVDSASGADSEHRDWYTWASAKENANTSEGSATGGKAWHAKGGDYYEATFWEGMPDLNFDNPEVRQEMIKIGKFWLEQGLDGFRLDAAKHIYEDFASSRKDKSTIEKNLAWWQEFRTALNETGKKPYLIGEVWEDSSVLVAPYLKEAFDSTFNFGLAGQILSTVESGRASNVSMISRTHEMFGENSGGAFVDAPFLSNHDQNRVMSQLNGNAEKAGMAASMLLTMAGNPFIYYGEEIGMSGAKPDEAIREPMIWYEAEDGGPGQTTWEARRYNKGGAASVEAQDHADTSMLNRYRQLIKLRNETPALRDGNLESYSVDDAEVMAYVRRSESDRVLVLHNLSSEPKTVKIDGYAEVLFASTPGAKVENNEVTVPEMTTVILK